MKAQLVAQIMSMTAAMEHAGLRSANWDMNFLFEQSEALLEHLKKQITPEYDFALMKLDLAELDAREEVYERLKYQGEGRR